MQNFPQLYFSPAPEWHRRGLTTIPSKLMLDKSDLQPREEIKVDGQENKRKVEGKSLVED